MSNHRKSRRNGFCCSRRRSLSISDRQLFRDTKRGKIAGVCAGLAAYLGIQIWLTRILAITALLFMPQIVFFAYLIAAFVLPTKAQLERSREEQLDEDAEADLQRAKQARFDSKLNGGDDEISLNAKRRTVRQFRDRFNRLDKRMQKLESYITSSQFELNREFRKI